MTRDPYGSEYGDPGAAECFGHLLVEDLIPALKGNDICLVYNEADPGSDQERCLRLFFQYPGRLHRDRLLSKSRNYFAENNKVYLAVMLEQGDRKRLP